MTRHTMIPFVSVLLALASVFCAAEIRAEEFKPFLTVKTASPNTLAALAEKISVRLDQKTIKPVIDSIIKETQGVNFNGPAGFALQCSQDGIVPMLFLPITDTEKFSHPFLDLMFLDNLKKTLKKEGSRYILPNPQGNIVLLQKKDYVIAVHEQYAAFAETADPKKIFTGQDTASLSIHLHIGNLELETVQKVLVMLSVFAAAQKQEIDVEEIMKAVKEISEQASSVSLEIFLDEKNLDGTLSWSVQTKDGSKWSAKSAKLKNAKTVLAGFVNNLPTAIISMRSSGVFTKEETEDLKKDMDTLLDAFLREITDNDDEELDKDLIRSCRKIADSLRKFLAANLQSDVLIESAYCLDSRGVLLVGTSAVKTGEIDEMAKQIYASLGKIKWKQFDGKALVKTIDAGLKQNVKTVGGASLSTLKLPLADLPFIEDAFWKKLTLHIVYAEKPDTSVVFGLGFDGGKTEQAITAVLEKSEIPAVQKEYGTFSFRQLGNAMINNAFPLQNIPPWMADIWTILAKADEKSGVLVTAEFSEKAFSGQAKIGGQIFDTIAELMKPPLRNKDNAAPLMPIRRTGSRPVMPAPVMPKPIQVP